MKTGLKLLPEDRRDLQLGSIIPIRQFPKLEELPKSFVFDTLEIKDQLDDFCSGNTTALLIGTNEGKKIDANWMFAKSKELSGNVDEWGQDLRTAFKVGKEFGALPLDNSPFPDDRDGNKLRDIKNWPDGLDFYASPQKQKTYWKITGPYDHFDNIRASIFYLNKKLGQKQGVGIGLMWGYPPSQYILQDIEEEGEGHAISFIGWETPENSPYGVLQNSWGIDAGKNGRHLISREIINHFVAQYGAFIYLDLPRDKAEYMVQNNIKLGENWLVQILKSLWYTLFANKDFGVARDPDWTRLRNEHIKANPLCLMCGKKGTQVHHVKPVWKFPEEEKNPKNFLTGCRDCHLKFYHLGSYRSYDLEAKKVAEEYQEKRKNRP